MAESGDAGAAKPASSWMPTGKDGVLLLLLMGGTVGGYKLVDARVEGSVEGKVSSQIDSQVANMAMKLELLTKRAEQADAAYEALQSDRLRDLRTGYEKIGNTAASLEALGRQLGDMRAAIEASERRSNESDRDMRREIAELRTEVNNALRQPLIGPKGR